MNNLQCKCKYCTEGKIDLSDHFDKIGSWESNETGENSGNVIISNELKKIF